MDILNEVQMRKFDGLAGEVRVWINPTRLEFTRLLQNVSDRLRAILDTSDKLYMWDAAIATHHEVATLLDLQVRFRLLLRPDVISVNQSVDENEFRQIPAIQLAYGDDPYTLSAKPGSSSGSSSGSSARSNLQRALAGEPFGRNA